MDKDHLTKSSFDSASGRFKDYDIYCGEPFHMYRKTCLTVGFSKSRSLLNGKIRIPTSHRKRKHIVQDRVDPFNAMSVADKCSHLSKVADIAAELLAGKLIDSPSGSPLSFFNDWVGLFGTPFIDPDLTRFLINPTIPCITNFESRPSNNEQVQKA